MKNALDAIAANYAAAGNAPPVLVHGASSALARQLEQGAPADVFISADEEWMDYLAARHRIVPATRFPLVSNRLALVAPLDNTSSIAFGPTLNLAGLLGRDGRLAIGDPRGVPAGKYAKAALEHLGLWAQVEQRLAPAENVRVALAMVARGEAPFGIVYASDQKVEPRTRTVALFPESAHPPIIYPAAAVAGGNQAAAAAFLAVLRGEAAMRVFRDAGFVVPPARQPTN
jgi:molybdate transport system substrate-binding protein